jgi:hypothetical protein
VKSHRPENAHQATLLRLLRDGPRSRAELADITTEPAGSPTFPYPRRMSRSKLNTELDRLVKLGLAEPDGLAASRGERRSGQVRLPHNTRFAGIGIGATSVDVDVAAGELRVLGHLSQPRDIRLGPEQVLDRVLGLAGKLREQGSTPSCTAPESGCRARELRRGCPGGTADHAGGPPGR